MKIEIHQLLCGEINKAWGLLKTTMPDIGIAKAIAFKADLQEQTSGIGWEAAIRGFYEGGYLLIMKTFEDNSAEVRKGRKFSHVLAISKADIAKIDDIEPVINLLPKSLDKNTVIVPIIIEVSGEFQHNSLPAKLQGRFNKLIHGYVNVKNYENTIVWIGQEDFDLIAAELWKRLSQDERQSFQFGILFNNENRKSDGISLMAVPETIQSKFQRSNFFLVGKNDNYQPIELVEQLIVGDPKAQQRISNFEKTIESGPHTREAIGIIAKGINTFEQFETISDIKKLNTLSHIIAQYAPSITQGADYKLRLLKRIVQLMESSRFSEINVLRGFKTESYRNAGKYLSGALIKWIDKQIFSARKSSFAYAQFFDLVRDEQSNWWDELLANELNTFLSTLSASKVSTVYLWITESPTLLHKIAPLIDKSKESEAFFLQMIPSTISGALIDELKIFSKGNNWFSLFAQMRMLQIDWEEVLTELLELDQNEDDFEAIDTVIKGRDRKVIVNYAVKSGDMRMIKRAGEICHKYPQLLAEIDVSILSWQFIWLVAIRMGNAVDAGLKNPSNVVYKLLDGVIAKDKISVDLLSEISQSDYGNAISYPNRVELWGCLPTDVKNNFLRKTSAGLLKKLSINSTTEIPDDTVLSDYIIKSGISDFLYFNKGNIKSVISIFEKFTKLSDDYLADYLKNYSGHINAIEATQLGKLINVRRYGNSAYAISNKAAVDNHWRFALLECSSLLGFMTAGFLVITGVLSPVSINEAQWWQSAEELIIELYPNGNALTTIWKKAGGKESELIMSTSAANAWSDALGKLRKGNVKGITMNDLLKEINKQYGDNPTFKTIYDLRKNFL